MAVLRLMDTPENAESTGVAQASQPTSGQLDKAAIQAELDEIMYVLAQNGSMEPDQVMLMCAGYLARLTELFIRILRVEHIRRDLKSVRTQEVGTLMDTVRDLYRIHSRLITVRSLDQELSR